MTDEKASSGGHPPLDSKVAENLLDKLSTDDSFRDLFVSDRAAALQQVGYVASHDVSVQCSRVKNLASKEEFAAAYGELKSYLTSSAALTVIFRFESGGVGSDGGTVA